MNQAHIRALGSNRSSIRRGSCLALVSRVDTRIAGTVSPRALPIVAPDRTTGSISSFEVLSVSVNRRRRRVFHGRARAALSFAGNAPGGGKLGPLGVPRCNGCGDRPDEARKLAGDGDAHFVLVHAPGLQSGKARGESKLRLPSEFSDRLGQLLLAHSRRIADARLEAVVPGRFHEQSPCMLVPGLGDRAFSDALAGGVLRRCTHHRCEAPGAHRILQAPW